MLEEVPQLLVASELDHLDLVRIPGVSKNRLDIALLHAEEAYVSVCAALTDEGAVSDRSVGAFIAVAIYTELVVGIAGQQLLEETGQSSGLLEVQVGKSVSR